MRVDYLQFFGRVGFAVLSKLVLQITLSVSDFNRMGRSERLFLWAFNVMRCYVAQQSGSVTTMSLQSTLNRHMIQNHNSMLFSFIALSFPCQNALDLIEVDTLLLC